MGIPFPVVFGVPRALFRKGSQAPSELEDTSVSLLNRFCQRVKNYRDFDITLVPTTIKCSRHNSPRAVKKMDTFFVELSLFVCNVCHRYTGTIYGTGRLDSRLL